MGFHICEYCRKETSGGDVCLEFENTHKYLMPDMIVHYVKDHGWLPPSPFIHDVMSGTFTSGERFRTSKIPMRIGYLEGEYPRGGVPPLFVWVLAGMMAIAEKAGNRLQTRGM